MTSKKLRVTRNPDEIKAFFREYVRLKCPVLLWQKFNNDPEMNNVERVVFNGYFSYFNEEKEILVLNYNPEANKKVNFNLNSTLYIKGEIQSILFKVDINFHGENKIIFTIPDEVRVCEKREKARINFGYNFDGKVEFFKYRAYRSKRQHSSAKLIDVSQGGLAMLMFTGKAHSWTAGDTFHIVSINGHDFPEPISGEIRYVRTIRITRNNQGVSAYRMGVKFERELSSRELTMILKQNPRQDSEDEEKVG